MFLILFFNFKFYYHSLPFFLFVTFRTTISILLTVSITVSISYRDENKKYSIDAKIVILMFLLLASLLLLFAFLCSLYLYFWRIVILNFRAICIARAFCVATVVFAADEETSEKERFLGVQKVTKPRTKTNHLTSHLFFSR